MDAEDHLFVWFREDWPGDKKSGLIYTHVSEGMIRTGELQFLAIAEEKP